MQPDCPVDVEPGLVDAADDLGAGEHHAPVGDVADDEQRLVGRGVVVAAGVLDLEVAARQRVPARHRLSLEVALPSLVQQRLPQGRARLGGEEGGGDVVGGLAGKVEVLEEPATDGVLVQPHHLRGRRGGRPERAGDRLRDPGGLGEAALDIGDRYRGPR